MHLELIRKSQLVELLLHNKLAESLGLVSSPGQSSEAQLALYCRLSFSTFISSRSQFIQIGRQ